jgi:hypothetical protein
MDEIASLLMSKYHSVAIYHTREPVEGSGFLSDEHCCLPGLFFPAAREGRTACANRDALKCSGAWSGLGLGGDYCKDSMAISYSQGTPERPGRRLFADPECAMKEFGMVKTYGSPDDYVVCEPVDVAESRGADIEVVAFLVDPIRMFALANMVNFSRRRPGSAVKYVNALACEQLYALPKAEGESDDPAGIVGLSEFFVRRFCSSEDMTFAVPYKLYKRILDDAYKSFLTTDKWKDIAGNKDSSCCE